MEAKLQKIFESIDRGTTAILLGGDEPLYEGMVCNQELLETLAQECRYPDTWPRALPEVSEYYKDLFGKPKLMETLVRCIDKPLGDSALLERIVGIASLADVFTTTFDRRLQHFFSHEEVSVVRSDEDASFALYRPRRLYKLNGDLDNIPALCVTKDDLIRLFARGATSVVMSHLAYNLTAKQFLIIGHHLNDWGFSFLYDTLTNNLGDFRVRSYALGCRLDPVLSQRWLMRNLDVLMIDPVEFFDMYMAWEKQT